MRGILLRERDRALGFAFRRRATVVAIRNAAVSKNLKSIRARRTASFLEFSGGTEVAHVLLGIVVVEVSDRRCGDWEVLYE
jgi:hypothetical protein